MIREVIKHMSSKQAQKQPSASLQKPYALTKQDSVQFYKDMLLIRRFEEKAGQLYGMGYIGGFCHLYIGQEAIITGMQFLLEEGDQVITGYRDHGHMLACGMDPNGVMAELTGRKDGYSKGKGGSMHMFSKKKNFFGGHGIVGAQVPIGTGLAFANRYRENHYISLTYFGDGAANQGQVFESFNMAKLWNLPALFIIENNEYAMGTSVERSTSERRLYRRGASFGIPGLEVDGMDIETVVQKGMEAVKHVRSGKGPFILEMKTYRYRGHSMSDPAKYRSLEEVQDVRDNRDPIAHIKSVLLKNKWAKETELKSIEKEIKSIINKSAEFSQKSPLPDPEELYTDIVL